jgi:large subunit ribosomal protein L27e
MQTNNQSVPQQVTNRSSKKTQARRSSMKTFIKVVNYNHIMPTRYQLDADLKAVVTPEALESADKKVEARKEARKLLAEKFASGKNRWFFTKLRF